MKPDIETLKRLYETERLTQYQIADQFGVDQSTVNKWLKAYDIQRQPKSTLAIVQQRVFIPEQETLKDLYITKRMSTRQIGAHFNVSKTEVRRWLIEYDITRRPPGNGLLYRGIQEPTKEELQYLVHEKHQSYREIGEMFGASGSAVTHWLRKHNIPQPEIWDTRYKGNRPTLPTRDELATLYKSGMTLDAIGDMFGVSGSTISQICDSYGIQVNPDGWNNGKRYLCQDGHTVKSIYEQRVDDWLSTHNVPHTYEPQLPCDRRYKADFLANGWYIEVWGVTNNSDYNRRRKQKCQLYSQHQYPLIELGLGCFNRKRQGLLERRLTKTLQAPVEDEHPSPGQHTQ